MPRAASHRQPRWATGQARRLLTAVACAMAIGIDAIADELGA